MEALAAAGAVVAWAGATTLCLADGRRGLAAGLVLAALGLALALATSGSDPLAAAAVGAGGLCSAAMRLRDGEPGWGMMPPGSTPRLVGSVVVLIAVGLIGGSGPGDPAATARLGALAVALVAAGRLLTVSWRWAALGAGAALALGLGALGDTPGMLAGALVAVGLGLMGGVEAPAART